MADPSVEVNENGVPIVGGNTSTDEDEFADAMADNVTATCPTAGCTSGANGAAWSWTGAASLAAVHLNIHHQDTHRVAAPAAPAADRRPRPPPLQPPRLEAQCSEARFEEFKLEWEFYRRSVDMPAGSGSSYLLGCLPEEVRKDVQAATNNAHTMTAEQLLATVKQYAVLQRAVRP